MHKIVIKGRNRIWFTRLQVYSTPPASLVPRPGPFRGPADHARATCRPYILLCVRHALHLPSCDESGCTYMPRYTTCGACDTPKYTLNFRIKAPEKKSQMPRTFDQCHQCFAINTFKAWRAGFSRRKKVEGKLLVREPDLVSRLLCKLKGVLIRCKKAFVCF